MLIEHPIFLSVADDDAVVIFVDPDALKVVGLRVGMLLFTAQILNSVNESEEEQSFAYPTGIKRVSGRELEGRIAGKPIHLVEYPD